MEPYGKTVVLPIGLLFLVFLVCPGCRSTPPDSIPFDSQSWKDCNISESDARFRMVPTLLKEHRLIGWTAAEIEALLGTTLFIEKDNARVLHHYQLGREHEEWGNWGYPFLTIEYVNGSVRRVYHLAGMGAVADHAPRQE